MSKMQVITFMAEKGGKGGAQKKSTGKEADVGGLIKEKIRSREKIKKRYSRKRTKGKESKERFGKERSYGRVA